MIPIRDVKIIDHEKVLIFYEKDGEVCKWFANICVDSENNRFYEVPNFKDKSLKFDEYIKSAYEIVLTGYGDIVSYKDLKDLGIKVYKYIDPDISKGKRDETLSKFKDFGFKYTIRFKKFDNMPGSQVRTDGEEFICGVDTVDKLLIFENENVAKEKAKYLNDKWNYTHNVYISPINKVFTKGELEKMTKAQRFFALNCFYGSGITKPDNYEEKYYVAEAMHYLF